MTSESDSAEGPKLTKSQLDFLISETQRREDKLDETIEVITRKAYYAFTLATTVFAVYLASVEGLIHNIFEPRMSTIFGVAGLIIYATGAWMFWNAHSTKDYIRVPNPERLVQELGNPSPDMKHALTYARADALVQSSRVADEIARIVDIQHDLLVLQIAVLLISWASLQLGI